MFANFARRPLTLVISIAVAALILTVSKYFYSSTADKSANKAPEKISQPRNVQQLEKKEPLLQRPPIKTQQKQKLMTAKKGTQKAQNIDAELPKRVVSEVVATVPPSCKPTYFKIEHFLIEVPSNIPEKIRAKGASTLPQDKFRFVRDELETHKGECIGRDELTLIIRKLTKSILDKGYTTTRLAIPEQNLSSGTLKITLVPGVIRAIRFEPDDTAISWKTAFPARPGDLLNLRDLEQGLEQIKRVPSQDADMQIVPGEFPGESDVVINHKQNKSWKLTATLDDSGTDGTGKLQGSLNLSIDNLLGINDLFNMGINNDAGNHGGNRGTQGSNAYYSMPFGNWVFTLSGSNYQYHQRIAGAYQTFVSSGESNNLELKMSYLLHRDQDSKSSIQVRTAKRWNSSFIDDTEIAVQRRNNTMAEIALIHKQNIGQAQLELTAAQRAGVHWFGAQEDLQNRLPSDPTFFYDLSVLDVTLSIPFTVAKHPFKYTHTLHAQSSQSSLYASEYISIGNRWTVRGFDGETSLAAERGWFIRNEFEMPISETQQAIYLGLDAGMVYGNNVPNLVGDHLAGAAIGMRGSLFKGMFYDVFSGWSIYRPNNYPTSEPASGFSLTYQF